MTAKQKEAHAIKIARQMLKRYWKGSLPVPVAAFAEREGVEVLHVEGTPARGKWRADSEAIVVGCELDPDFERYAVARCLGLACGLEFSDLFAYALLMPEELFAEKILDKTLSLSSVAEAFGCRYEDAFAWASRLGRDNPAIRNAILLDEAVGASASL